MSIHSGEQESRQGYKGTLRRGSDTSHTGRLKRTGYRRPEVEYGETIVEKGETKKEETRLTKRGEGKKKKEKGDEEKKEMKT